MSVEKDISRRVYVVKDNVIIIPFRDEGLQILAYGREFVFKGKVATVLIPRILQFVDGQHSVAEVCDKVIAACGPIVEASVITQTIRSLEQQSLLREAAPIPLLAPDEREKFRAQLDFFAAFENNGNVYQARLKQHHLGLFVVGDMAETIARAVAPLGIGNITLFQHGREAAGKVGEIVCHPLTSLDSEHLLTLVQQHKLSYVAGVAAAVTCRLWESLNQVCLAAQLPMTRVEVAPLRSEIGPTVLPGRSACYQCFDLRRQSLKISYDEYKNLEAHLHKNDSLRPFVVHPLFVETTASMAAYEIMRVMSGYFYPQTYNQVVQFDFLTMEIVKHPVLKLPRCPACSPVNRKPMKEAYPKAYGGG